MASKSPVTSASTAGFTGDSKDVLYIGGVTLAGNRATSGQAVRLGGLRWEAYYFGGSNSANDVDDGDTWDSDSTIPPPPGTVIAFWCPLTSASDAASASVTSTNPVSITFETASQSNRAGWVLCGIARR